MSASPESISLNPFSERNPLMTDVTTELLKAQLRQLRLPTMGREFETLARSLAGRRPKPGVLDHPYWSDPEPCSMHIDEVEAIWARIAEDDDWRPFEAKVAAIRRMGEAMRENGPDRA